MSNKYLEKIAEIEDLQNDLSKLTLTKNIWSDRDIARKHGYDVSPMDMYNLNLRSAYTHPLRDIKNVGGGALAGAGAGALAGYIAKGDARRGAAIGTLLGSLVGAGKNMHETFTKSYPDDIRNAVESGRWKRIEN